MSPNRLPGDDREPRRLGTPVTLAAVAILSVALLLLLSPSLFRISGNWWNRDWSYRRSLTIINTSEVNLREYQVLVNLDTRALVSAGKMRKDGADLRFVDENGKELPYWIESGLGTRNTEIWVKVPSIPLSDGSRIHIYYGNPDSGAGSNGSLTFEFYSPFERRRKLDLGEGFVRLTMKEPLSIPSYEARGVVHPDVLYFPDGVDGYMYWMYYTPYPPDKYELPRLVRSRDGLNFTNEGSEHLLLEAGESGQWDDGFLADPDILKLGDKWYLFYAGRSANKSWQKVGLATSNDGIHFTKHPLNPVLEADLDLEYESHDYLLSPTLYHNESGFYMWYFAEGREGNRTKIWMCGAKSENGTHWEKLPQNPLLAPQPASLDQKGIWHGDVIRFHDHFWLYYVAYDRSEYHISLAKSRNGVEWERSDENPVLDTRPNSWEDLRMYRSSAVVVDDELRLYYSAFNSSYVPGIGLARSWQGLTATRPDLSEWAVEGYAHCSHHHARRSEYSLEVVGQRDQPTLRRDVGGAFDYTIWFYDDLENETGYAALLEASDSGLNSVAVGVSVNHDPDGYLYVVRSEGQGIDYRPSNVARTEGWHRLSLRASPDSTRILVDDVLIGETTSLVADNVHSLSIRGGYAGVAHFDDLRVRKYASPEPEVQLGREERN